MGQIWAMLHICVASLADQVASGHDAKIHDVPV